jgi:hypothetical protein
VIFLNNRAYYFSEFFMWKLNELCVHDTTCAAAVLKLWQLDKKLEAQLERAEKRIIFD